MKNIRKITALFSALFIITALLSGCRNEKKLSEDFEIPKNGCESAIKLPSGEIMVYETLKTEKNIEGKVCSSVTETYIKFVQGDELEYDFTESEKITSTGEVNMFEATRERGKLTVTRNGEKLPDTDEPDIFGYFRIDYEIADVDRIEVLSTGDGQTLYTVTMTGAYADRFDSSENGVDIVCDKVLYNYYVDSTGVTRNVLSEFTSTLTCDGESQTIVRFVQATIE